MKKINIIILNFLMLVLLAVPVHASTNTETRTEDDLKVSDDIIVTGYNTDNILNTPKVDETEKIYDFADLFTDDEENDLYEKVTKFIKKSDLDMAIVTINDNPKYSAQIYADDFYDYNYFGVGDNHDGILFLIDMDTREVYISTTGKAIEVYTDMRINRMLDKICEKSPLNYPYNCAEKFVETAQKNFNTYKYGVRNFIIAMSFLIALIATIIIVKAQCDKHKNVKIKLSGKEYLDKQSVKILVNENRLVNSYVRREIRMDDTGGHGGSFGGSSTHHSSSGRSHGGGGRRF